MRGILLGWCGLIFALALAGADTGTDPTNRYAWGENVGWVNAGPTNAGVSVHFDGNAGWLSGHAWGENVGWIKMGADVGGPYANTATNNWGVNMDASGDLSGYAWGENIGWINFGHERCDVAINLTNGSFSGHAWGENVGWLKFSGSSPDYGVRTLAFEAQAQGTPNWWLSLYGIEDENEIGIKGIPAWQDYVSDTNPTNPGSIFHVEAVSFASGGVAVSFWPASTRRYYTLLRRVSLLDGGWSEVPGQAGVPGDGGEQALQDTNQPGRTFYSVRVTVGP